MTERFGGTNDVRRALLGEQGGKGVPQRLLLLCEPEVHRLPRPRCIGRSASVAHSRAESNGNVGHFGLPSGRSAIFDALACGEYASTRKKVKTALWLTWIVTSPRPTPGPLAVEALPAELTSLPATVPDLLRARAAQADDAVLIAPGSVMTFGEADRESARLAARLWPQGSAKGLGSVCCIRTAVRGSSPGWRRARIGALTVPLSTFAPGPELARALRHTDVHAVLMAGWFAGDSLAARLEAGLPGLAESGSDALSRGGAAPSLGVR